MNKLYRFMISRFLLLFSPVIKIWENNKIKKYSKLKLKHQPVFIIGAPRTGSTILYQTLTNQLNVMYMDNLVCRFYLNTFFGFWLSTKIFKEKAHNSFKSNHGDTSKYGLHAPSECGNFWYRWLPKNKHFIDYDDISETVISEIRDEITAIINYFDKPIVFKNLNAGQRLRLLKKCFPEAKFIFITREPLFTAQSILKAKRKVGLSDSNFWSIQPKNVKELEKLNAYEQIVKQVFYLEKQIVEDIRLFDKESFLFIKYNELGEYFDTTLDKCTEFIGVKSKKDFKNAKIKLTEKISLNEEEIKSFNEEIEKLDWKSYSDK
ncbi:sulfotransferase [Sulfurimonas sp.]|uniref:sulfotransferase n=1 Tax=Sulfurimonas sp. TaxID=2022749 RepID=UPI0035643FDF